MRSILVAGSRARLARFASAGLCIAASWASPLAMPNVARSATVTLEPKASPTPGDGPPSGADIVRFKAGPGERNVVSAQFAWQPGEGTWTITDSNAPVTAVEPCRSVDAHMVVCTAAEDHYIDQAEFELGDLDDLLHSTSPTGEAIGVLVARGGSGDDELVGGSDVNTLEGGDGNDLVRAGDLAEFNGLNGGPGNDRLLGSRRSDTLDGGGGSDQIFGGGGDDQMTDGDRDGAVGDAAPGPDLLDGGSQGCCLAPRGDRVIYRNRTGSVRVDLGDEAPDGEPGEGDVLRGIESIEGGRGDDLLVGDDRGNALIGSGGHDRLRGRGGRDTLTPGQGGSELSCGPGLDVAAPEGSTDVLDHDCERIDVSRRGLFFDSPLRSAPRMLGTGAFAYRIGCSEDDSDGESNYAYDLCRGKVQVREATGQRRPLAGGGFPAGHWARRTVVLALTPLGRRLASRRSVLRVTMRIDLHSKPWGSPWSTDAMRWTVRMRL
jgi:Ca2+-binding RTX toxin-like protein